MKDVIIIPTYNESENIEIIVPQIFSIIPNVCIYVVDDNSPDGTAGVVKNLMKKHPKLNLIQREKKEGLGKAYIHAFKKVLEDKDVNLVVMMDADLSHDPHILPLMIKHSKDHDVIIGSRYVKGGRTVGWELRRKILSRGGNIYTKLITRMPINDCTGGFNAISAGVLRKVPLDDINVAGYAFIMHLKFLLYKSGATFFEIPICFKNRVEGVSKLSNMIIREGILAPWSMIFSRKK